MYVSAQMVGGLLSGCGTAGAAVDDGAIALAGAREAGGRARGVVAIAASLGGVEAVSKVLADLPADFPLPILVVQHVNRCRPSLFPNILSHRTTLRVKAAEEGDVLVPGSVHVAPPDRHLLLRPDGALGLSRAAPVNFCRPSADVLFRSLADAFGPRTIAVVLTGMGRDGARGVEAVGWAGGATVAQDGSTAQAADMPHAAIDIGRADLVLSLHRIGFALQVLAERAGERSGPSGSRPDEATPTVITGRFGLR